MTENQIFPKAVELVPELNSTDLSGVNGSNRETSLKCQINANNDLEAVFAWLNCYQNKPTTYRTYKKEAERLLFWCIHNRKKPLSSLDQEDFLAYFDFLEDPKPRNFWCTENNTKYARTNPNWKPFSGGLSSSAKNTAIIIINSLMNFLFNARYLEFNPLKLVRNIRTTKNSFQEAKIKVLERILEEDEWEALKETVFELPEETDNQQKYKARMRFIVAIMFLLGLRINELVTSSWNAFRLHKGKWWFFVRGKGDKLGMVPVNDELLFEIKVYRSSIGLSELPEASDELPIITSIRNNKPITTRQVHKLLKELGEKTSLKFSDEQKINKLKGFSPHWLRHLSATIQADVGVRFEHIKANHRHENENTTRKYIHTFDEERHEDMQKLKFTKN